MLLKRTQVIIDRGALVANGPIVKYLWRGTHKGKQYQHCEVFDADTIPNNAIAIKAFERKLPGVNVAMAWA